MKEAWKEEGARLRDVRRACRFSQADLADVLGVTRSAVSLYERGRRELSEEARAWMVAPLGFARQRAAAANVQALRVRRRMGRPACAR